MANPHKGETGFDAGGVSYTLRFSVDAICALEEIAGKGVVAIAADLSDPERVSMSLLRKVLWAGLRQHHAELDLQAAGELILAAGGLVAAMGLIGKALSAAFPEGGDPPPPPPPQAAAAPAAAAAGTGAGSAGAGAAKA